MPTRDINLISEGELLRQQYHRYADEAARAHGIRPELIRAMIKAESGFNPRAVSKSGALGLMQLMPSTAIEMGVKDPYDPLQNIRGGVRYLRSLLDRFRGDERLALAGYNAGPRAVAQAGGVPALRETQGYVQRILREAPPPELVSEDQLSATPPMDIPPKPVLPELPGPSRIKPGAIPPPGEESFGRQAARMATSPLPLISVDPLTLAGGIGGATLLAPTSGPVGAAVGAGVGTGLGSTLNRYIREKAGLATPPTTLLEAGQQAAADVATGAVGEFVGQKAARGLQKVAAPFAKKLTTAGRQALTYLKEPVARPPVDLERPVRSAVSQVVSPFAKAATSGETYAVLPAQVSDSKSLNILDNVFAGSLFGATRKQVLSAEEKRLGDVLGDLPRQYGLPLSREEAGRIYTGRLAEEVKRFHETGTKLYNRLFQQTVGVRVPTASLEEFASKELAKRGALPSEVSGQTGLRLLSQVVRKSEEAVSRAGTVTPQTRAALEAAGGAEGPYSDLAAVLAEAEKGSLPFEQAHFFHSELGRLARNAEQSLDPNKDVIKGIAQQLAKRLDESMAASIKGTPAEGLWSRTREFYKAGKEKLESEYIRKLAAADPEFLAKQAALGMKVGPTKVRAAREAVGSRAWRPVQQKTMEELIRGPGEGLPKGAKLLDRLDRIGADTLKEIFPTGEGQSLYKLGNVLKQLQKKGEGTGKVWIQLAQAGALAGAGGGLIGLATGDVPLGAATGAAILITPPILARIMLSPVGRKWFTTGLTLPKGSPEAVRAAGHLAVWLARQKQEPMNVPPTALTPEETFSESALMATPP